MQQFLQFIILTFIYSSTCFGRLYAHHQKLNKCSSILWFYLRSMMIAVLLAVAGPAGRPTDRADYQQRIRYCTIITLLFIKFCNTFSRWLITQKPKHATHSTLVPVIHIILFVNTRNFVDGH
jgi:hypothetical protein